LFFSFGSGEKVFSFELTRNKIQNFLAVSIFQPLDLLP
jgi:hypothetical protein